MTATKTSSGEQLVYQQGLVCRLRKRITERTAHIPTAGEVELENGSPLAIEIEVRTSPLQYLNLIVTNGEGRVVSDSFYGDLFSPLDEPYTLRLQPGQKYSAPVGLLGNVSEANQHPGIYTVQAVYEYNGLRSVSNPLQVELAARHNS
jgi:hypothetical protein